MKILHAMLENFCQHRSRELTFQDGVTFITGSNGAGKSNLFRAIRGTLTGDFDSRVMKGKAQDVTYGLEKGADSTVATAWNLGHGREFEVKRSIINTGSASVYELGEKTFIGKETEVTDRVMRLLGVSKAVVQDCMFIAQRRVGAIFEMTDSARVDTLIGLTDAARASELLQHLRKRYARYSVYVDDFDQTEVATSQNNFEQAKQAYKKAQAVHAEIKSRTLLPIEQERVSRIIQAREHAEELASQILAADKDIEMLESIIKDEEATKKKANKNATIAQRKYAAAKKEYERAEAVYNDAVRLNREFKHYQSLLSDLKTPLPVKPTLKKSKELTEEEVEECQDLVRAYESTIRMYHDKVCVTCNRPFSVSDEEFEKARTKLGKVKEKLKENEANEFFNRSVDEAFAEHQDSVKRINAKKVEAEKLLEELYFVPPKQVKPVHPDPLAMEQAEAAMDKHVLIRDRKNQKCSELNGRLVETVNERQRKRRRAEESIAQSDKDYMKALAQWKVHEEATHEFEKSSDTLRAASNELTLAIRSLRSANFSKRKVSKMKPTVEVLETSIDVCKRLPCRTIAELAKRMEPAINGKLEQMGMDFTLSVNELLQFSITRHGHTFPRERMSGGQCCVAGMAFWMTVADVAGLDCIFMDEPIDGLDAEAEAMLPDVFTQLDANFREAGKQLIVVTHHRQLAQVGNRIHIG